MNNLFDYFLTQSTMSLFFSLIKINQHVIDYAMKEILKEPSKFSGINKFN